MKIKIYLQSINISIYFFQPNAISEYPFTENIFHTTEDVGINFTLNISRYQRKIYSENFIKYLL